MKLDKKEEFVKKMVENGLKESSAKTYARAYEKKTGRLYKRSLKLWEQLMKDSKNNKSTKKNEVKFLLANEEETKKSEPLKNMKSEKKGCSNRVITAIQSVLDLSEEIGSKKSLQIIKILVDL